MSDVLLTKDNLFKAAPRRPVSKADITDNAAREIIRADADQHSDKKARLRKARLEMEAIRGPAEPASKPRKAAGAKPRRGKSSM